MSQTFTIRPAVASDIDEVFSLAVQMVLASRSDLRPEVEDREILEARRRNLANLEALLELPEGAIFVAQDAHGGHLGHVICMGNNLDSVSEVAQAWVYDLSVRPDSWGLGVGRALMAQAEDFARSLGLGWIGLGVTFANQRALGFYQEIGYGIERVQMVKRLETV